MRIILHVLTSKVKEKKVRLTLPATIGRSREASLTVAHAMISRKHCELYELDGKPMIRDLGSLNGTLIGGEQISEVELVPGMEFTVGPVTFRVELEGVDAIPEAQPQNAAESQKQSGDVPNLLDADAEASSMAMPVAHAIDDEVLDAAIIHEDELELVLEVEPEPVTADVEPEIFEALPVEEEVPEAIIASDDEEIALAIPVVDDDIPEAVIVDEPNKNSPATQQPKQGEVPQSGDGFDDELDSFLKGFR